MVTSITNIRRNILRYIVAGIVCILILGTFAVAQNLQVATATVKLSDLDNNGYANLGDKITPIQIYLDGVPNDGTDSIHVGIVFGYYGSVDTLYLTKSGGSAGGGKGNNVFASYTGGSNFITAPAISPGLNGINASAATIPSNGIFRFLLFKKTAAPISASAGAKTILQTIDVKLVSDGLSPALFNNIVDNIVPATPVSDSLTITDNSPTAFRAGVGDVINLRVDTLGTGGFITAYAQFNTNTDRDNAGVLSTALLPTQKLGSGATQTGFLNNLKQLNGTTSFTSTLTLNRGSLDIPPATSNLGLRYYIVDAAGNVNGPILFENSPKAIDNTVSDLFSLSGTDSLVTVSDSLTDLTTDGIIVSGGLESYIVGSKVVFKYTEPSPGNVQSVNINLTPFGIASTLPMTYSYKTGGGNKVFLTTVQTFTVTTTDGNLNTIKPSLTITDSAGNIFSGGVGSFASIRRVDLIPPGNFTVTPIFTDNSTVPNNIANPNDLIKFTISNLNSDADGYRIMANKPNIRTSWTASQRDLNAGSFPTTGSINTGAVPVAGVYTTSNTSVSSYTPTSSPAGLDIAANSASGLATIVVRDEAGNEATATTTIPVAINNIVPNPAQTATVTLSNDVNANGIANIGDSLLFTISGSGVDNAVKDAYIQVLSRQFGNVGQQIYNNVDHLGTNLGDADGGNVRPDWIKLTRVSGNFIGKIPVIRDLNNETTYLSALANTQIFSYLLVDSAGNNSGIQSTTTLAQAFDNKVNDLYTIVGVDTTVAVVDSLTDATTDGIGGAYILGTKIKFKYTEPVVGNVSSVTIDLSAFGGGSSVNMPLNSTDGTGLKTFATTLTLAAANTDAVLNTLRPRLTVIDVSGNTYNGFAKINTALNVDLIRPSSGTLSVALSLPTESTTPNNVANAGEALRAVISGLNVDDNAGGGYRIFAYNPNININFTGAQRNLITSTFPTTGVVDGGGFQTVVTSNDPIQTNSGNCVVGSYNTISAPAGLNIAANVNSGRTLFIIRDDAGNEDTVSAVMPFAVDNIIPATPQTATYTLQYDANGNNIANIGDSVKITVSGSGVDANIAAVYARVPSTIFGSVGQQNYTIIDRFGTNLFNDDGGIGLPDYIRLTKVGNNFAATFRLISDLSSEFAPAEFTPGTATLRYHIIDNGGNNQSGFAVAAGNALTTTALPQRFDNKIPAPSTIAPTMTTSNPNAGMSSTNYITVGSSVIINVPSVPADVDTVFADLRPLGLTANEALLKPALNVVGTASKTFIVPAATSTYMDYPSALDSARIPITMRDQSGNISLLNTKTVSDYATNAGTPIYAVDRNAPTAIAQNRVTIIHTDYDANNAVTPSDNNGKINVGERVRILIDVSNQPDFFTANVGTGFMVVDLTAFGRGVQTVLANTAAPSPGLPGAPSATGYDPATNRFVFDFDVANGGADNLAPGSVGIIVRNLSDNAGNQSNPTNANALYTNLTVPQAIDAQQPAITIPPTNSFAFSPFTDVNGDGIAAIGDGVTVNAIVVGADSVFADLRKIGRGIVPMTLGSGNTWSIVSTTVLQANDLQWASDNDFGNTSLNIIAQDVNGNQSNATTAVLPVDNLVTKAPTMTVQPASGGRFALRIEDGQSVTTPLGTLGFSTDMSGGSVPNTSLYQIYFDSTGTGTFSLAGTMAYSNPATFTSSQVFSNGKVVSFRVVPLDNTGNIGATSITGTAVAQITLPPAITYEPADQTIIGSTAISLRARIDSANISKITAVTFKSRAVDSDPGTSGNQAGTWFTIGGASQTGGVWTLGGVSSGSFTGTFAVGNSYQVIAVLTDNANPVNTQTNEQALAANGSISIFADNQAPNVTLSSVLVNGLDSTFTGLDNTPNPFLDIKARGIVAFKFAITDNLPLNNNTATMSFRVNGTNTVIAQTISSLITSGMVSVNGNIYTVRLNTTPYASLNIPFAIQVNDGRGNVNPVFGSVGFGYSFTFSVADDVQPAYFLIQPFAGSTFGSIGFNAQFGRTALANNANGWTEAVVQLSTTAAFTSPIHIATITGGGTGTFALPIPSSLSLISGTKYYIRAIIRDDVGNTITTDPNMVYYDISTPTFTVSFPSAVTVGGIPKVTGVPKAIITSSTNDLTSLTVRMRRIDQDTTNYSPVFTPIANTNPYSFNLNFSGFFPFYNGLMVLEITGTDAAGNNFPAQYSTVYLDNEAPVYIVTSVNGDDELASFTSMIAGDTLTVQLQVKSDDVASGEFSINNYGSGNVKVLGFVSVRNGRNFTVKFPMPTDANDQSISMNPQAVGGANDFTVVFRDSLNNASTNAQYVGISSIGTVMVINNAKLSLIINNVQRGWVLSKNFLVTTRTTATTATFSGVQFQIKRPGNTTFETIAVDNSEPYSTTIGSTNYVDGLYVLRAVALTNNGNTEAASDTVSVVFDNANNKTTERATIVSLNNARIGGGAITISASAGTGVSRVQFQSRFMSPIGVQPVGWVTLGLSSIPNAPNTFSLVLTAQDIAGKYGLAINQLDGRHEFRAVAEDNAGFAYYLFNNPTATMATPGFGTVANTDDLNEVATTTATVDVTAPTGIFNLAGIPLTTIQSQPYTSAAFNTMNVIDGSVIVRALVTDTSDFGQGLVTIHRLGVRDPGTAVSAYGDQEGIEKTVATYTSASTIQYAVNSNSLVRGGLYRVRIKLRDNLGNENTIQTFDFIAGKPQASVVGYNAEQKVLYVLGQNHAQSVKLEYSTNNGTSYSEVNALTLPTQFGTSNATLDAARTGSFSMANINLPVGQVLFRVTASELASGQFSQSRYASAPSYFRMTVSANGSWVPSNLASASVGILLNRQQGTLNSTRVEAIPASQNDYVSLFMYAENNPFNSISNTLATEVFPKHIVSSNGSFYGSNQTLISLDNRNYGFSPTASINLSAGTPNISTGGLYTVFASVVRNDSVDMNYENIFVNRVAANRGDTITSTLQNTTMAFPVNSLSSNAGILLEDDGAKLISTAVNQINMGQVGVATWFNVFGGPTLRNGSRSTITMKFTASDIVDANKDGVINGLDELMITVAVLGAGPTYTFPTDIRNKTVDTINNIVSFTIGTLPSSATRYMLLLDGANNTQQGTITLTDFRVGTIGKNNFIMPPQNTTTAQTIVIAVADNVSGLKTTSPLLYIDNVRATFSPTFIDGDRGFRGTVSLTNTLFNLDEGKHTVRFIIENNNGNRLDKSLDFFVDRKPVYIANSTPTLGYYGNRTVTFTLKDPSSVTVPASKVDSSTVFVDLFATRGVTVDSVQRIDIEQYLYRLSPGQMKWDYNGDSVRVSFDVVDNLVRVPFDGYEIVVNDGLTNLTTVDFDSLKRYGFSTLNGVSDIAGNQSKPFNFRVSLDKFAPTVSVLKSTVEGVGVRLKISDDFSGVDSSSISLMEINSTKNDTVLATLATKADLMNYKNNILSYKAKRSRSFIFLSVKDYAGNSTTFEFNTLSSDTIAPTLTVLSKNSDGTGVRVRILDGESGIDTLTFKVVEIDSEKKDSTVMTNLSNGLTFSDSILVYKPKNIGNTIKISVSDKVGNSASTQFITEETILSVKDFHIYPNPFNPDANDANVFFRLSRTAVVTIEVFDWLGRSVGSIIDRLTIPAGVSSGIKFTGRLNGSPLANGVYFLKITALDLNKTETATFKAVIAVKK